LASADEVTLSFAGNDLIGFTIDKATAEGVIVSPEQLGTRQSQAGITNKGTITANGGQVILSAKAAGDLLKTVINNEGIIQAQTIEDRGGKIYLLGGMDANSSNAIQIGGTLDASAPNGGDGGFIETSAAKVNIADDAVITTYAPYGKTGEWLIDPTDYNIAASGGDRTGAALSTNLGTTNVTILSSDGLTGTSGDINVNDAVSWSANTLLTLSAYRNVNVNSNITATGNTAGLTLTPSNTGAGGNYYLNNGAVITLSGSTPGLTIAGNAYTVINDATALQNMNGNLAGFYALGSNIDAADTSTWNAGEGFEPVVDFTGAFDGLGHTITGLTINRPTQDYVGLFGYASTGSILKNVGLLNGNITGNYCVGGLVGLNEEGTITNSYNTGTVSGSYDYVGGLVGLNSSGTITDSYNTGTVSGRYYVGGLVGYNEYGNITNSYSTGAVSGSAVVGGLVGYNYYGTITNSYSTVTGSGDIAGGLVGYNDNGTITDSYSTAAVTG
ncbi:MAG: GLUG motif-containing protein, partial [Patescibacteria group bacterium]